MTIEELIAQINYVNIKLANEKNLDTRNKLNNQLKVLNLKKEIETIKKQIEQLSKQQSYNIIAKYSRKFLKLKAVYPGYFLFILEKYGAKIQANNRIALLKTLKTDNVRWDGN